MLQGDDVGHDDAQQIVGVPGHQIAFHHFGNFSHRFFERVQIGLILTIEGDVDEHIPRIAGLLLIDQRRLSLAQPAFFQRAHSAQAGRLG